MGTEGMKYSLVSREVMPIQSKSRSTASAWTVVVVAVGGLRQEHAGQRDGDGAL